MENTKRLNYIDAAKGVGIILVVLAHHLRGGGADEPYVYSVTQWINSFHMPLFFIISGFLYEMKNEEDISFKSFLKQKSKSVLYPYFTFSAVLILWYALFYIVLKFNSEVSFAYVLISSVTTYGYHALWFLPALFGASVLFIFYKKSFKKLSPLAAYAFGIAGLLLCFTARKYFYDESNPLRYIFIYFGRMFIASAYVFTGSLIFKISEAISKNKKRVLIETLICVFSLILSLSLFRKNELSVNLAVGKTGNPFLYCLNSLSGSLFVLYFSKLLLNKSRILSYFGRNSLIIMALHMDISIEISYMALGVLNVGDYVKSTVIISLLAILGEFVFLIIAIEIINRFLKFLLRPVVFRKKDSDALKE